MAVAFTREEDYEAQAADLPDRPVSTHPNLVTASGLAAQYITFASLAGAGDHIVASANLYGGSITQLDVTLRRFGVGQVTATGFPGESAGVLDLTAAADASNHPAAARMEIEPHLQSTDHSCGDQIIAVPFPGLHPKTCSGEEFTFLQGGLQQRAYTLGRSFAFNIGVAAF